MFKNNYDRLPKIEITDIKKGLLLTVHLSKILNNNFECEKFFNELCENKPTHYIEYLKSKLGNATSHHTKKFSGALYISCKNIPDEERIKIINSLNKIYNIEIKLIKITTWFIKWVFCELGIFWMQDVLNISEKELDKEWNNYLQDDFDSYILSLNDMKLQKYIDAINKMRVNHPSRDEIMDIKY